jgi:hypothetical protein
MMVMPSTQPEIGGFMYQTCASLKEKIQVLSKHLIVHNHLLLHKILFSSNIRIQRTFIARRRRHRANTATTTPS